MLCRCLVLVWFRLLIEIVFMWLLVVCIISVVSFVLCLIGL